MVVFVTNLVARSGRWSPLRFSLYDDKSFGFEKHVKHHDIKNSHSSKRRLMCGLHAACAAVGNADAAFQIQAEMEREGFAVDKQCATSLINACSKELLHTSEHQRRQRLVLLERAGDPHQSSS